MYFLNDVRVQPEAKSNRSVIVTLEKEEQQHVTMRIKDIGYILILYILQCKYGCNILIPSFYYKYEGSSILMGQN